MCPTVGGTSCISSCHWSGERESVDLSGTRYLGLILARPIHPWDPPLITTLEGFGTGTGPD